MGKIVEKVKNAEEKFLNNLGLAQKHTEDDIRVPMEGVVRCDFPPLTDEQWDNIKKLNNM